MVQPSLDAAEVLYYTLGEQSVASLMSDIVALQRRPDHIAAVPGTQPWMLGIADIAGGLLPIVDLPLFLGLSAVTEASNPLLVVQPGDLHMGLLVNRVLGHPEATLQYADMDVPELFQPYVRCALSEEQSEMLWPVFDLAAVAADPRLQTVCV